MFQKCHSESYLISVIFKVLSNYKAYWKQHLKDTLQFKILYGHGSTYVLIFSRVIIMKQKWAKVPWKLLVAQKLWACSLKNIEPRYFTYYCILLFLWNEPSFQIQPSVPANIRLDEDVLKMSFVFVFRRRLQDVLIKTNIVALLIRLQKRSSRHLQDVFQRCLQDVFKTYHQVKLSGSRICLGHTSEKFMISVENLQLW